MSESSEILLRLEPLLSQREDLNTQIETLRGQLLSALETRKESDQSVIGNSFIASLRTNTATRRCLYGRLEEEYPEIYQTLFEKNIIRVTEPSKPKSLVLRRKEEHVL